MKKLVFLALLLTPTTVLAQGGFVHDIVLQRKTLANPSITYTQPIAGALVRVCTGGGTPCTPLASLFSNAALTTPKTNPTSTDINGNFNFWAAPGPYTVGITVNGVTTNYDYTVDYTNPASIGTNVGSTNQVLFNNGSVATGSDNFMWDDTNRTLSVRTGGNPSVRILADLANSNAGKILLGTGTAPFIEDFTGSLVIRTANTEDVLIGTLANPTTYILGANGGASGVPLGVMRIANGSVHAKIELNNGNNMAGVFDGATIIVGFEADPNGVYAAKPGSIYLTTNGGAGTSFWVKESMTNNMGWVGK